MISGRPRKSDNDIERPGCARSSKSGAAASGWRASAGSVPLPEPCADVPMAPRYPIDIVATMGRTWSSGGLRPQPQNSTGTPANPLAFMHVTVGRDLRRRHHLRRKCDAASQPASCRRALYFMWHVVRHPFEHGDDLGRHLLELPSRLHRARAYGRRRRTGRALQPAPRSRRDLGGGTRRLRRFAIAPEGGRLERPPLTSVIRAAQLCSR